jgi:flagellar motility protein MotE (MotC chaperone)
MGQLRKIKTIIVILVLTLGFQPALWMGDHLALQTNLAFAQEETKEEAQEETPEAETEPKEEEIQPQEKVSLPDPVPGISPETFRMIEMIEKKNRDLKRREAQITIKEQRLKTLEENILKDLQKIEDAIARSEEQIGIQKNLIKENVAGLIKAYSAMKPQEAAKLLEVINENLAIQIISGMKSKVAGKVLSKLNVRVAKNISEKLAGKRIPKK